ncbi:MAG: DUF5050 domain-containing protein, partial [Bacillota bacterium]|nr:DUF5050 domain-containing protein [Bacillota bacterium]
YCTSCGLELKDEEKFCSGCGYSGKMSQGEESVIRIDDGDIVRLVELDASERRNMRNRLQTERKLQAGRKFQAGHMPQAEKKFQFTKWHTPLLLPAVLALVIILVLSGGNVNRQGNTIDNTLHGGTTAVQGRWIYFSDQGGLYRMNSGDGTVKKLAEGSFGSLNVVGDWIYYNSGNGIGRIRTNGQGKTDFSGSEQGIQLMMVIDSDIYYMNYSSNSPKLYRMNSTGGDKKELGDYGVVLGIGGDRIITLGIENMNRTDNMNQAENNMPGYKIYSMKKDGTDKKVLFEIKDQLYGYMKLQGRNFYYTASDNGAVELKQYNWITGDTTTLLEKNMTACSIEDGWIYYADANGDLFRIRPYGRDKKKITSGVNFNFSVSNGWIIYNDSQTGRIYRVREDGTGKEAIGTAANEQGIMD